MSHKQEPGKPSITVERKVHKALKEIWCNPSEFGNIASNNPAWNMSEEQLKAYIEQEAAEAQAHENTKSGNVDLMRSNDMLERLQTMGVDQENCAYDVAIVLKTIANTEAHPTPKSVGNIDLQKIYSTLSQLAMGHPVEELDACSKRFLFECYDDLRLSIDHKMWSRNVEDLQQHFNEPNRTDLLSPSATDEKPAQVSASLVESLQSAELNPFEVPIEFLQLQ